MVPYYSSHSCYYQRAIYKLDVVEIPTNKPIIRLDNEDLIYKTRKENMLIKNLTLISLLAILLSLYIGCNKSEESLHQRSSTSSTDIHVGIQMFYNRLDLVNPTSLRCF